MNNLNLVDSKNVFLFVFEIKNKEKKESALLNFLSTKFPFELKKEQVIICSNKNLKSYLCFVSKNGFTAKQISSVLYVKNHFKNYSGIIAVKKSNAQIDYISLKNGAVEWCKNTFDDSLTVSKYITEQEICSSYKDKDLLYKRKFYNYLKIYSSVIYGLFFVFILLTAMLIFFNAKTKNYNKMLKFNDELNKQKIEKSKSLKKEIAQLKKQLFELKQNDYGNCYSRISLLYDCLGKNTEIRNLNLDKNSFTIDVVAKDAVKILSNFEKYSALLKDVKMNRSTNINDGEKISFSGNFVSTQLLPDFNNLDEEFQYYKTEVEAKENLIEKNNKIKVSDYTAMVRTYFKKYALSEQFIQFSLQGDVFVLECSLLASSYGLLNFLKIIQTEQNVSIEKLNINCSQSSQKLRCLIYFYTGILKNNIMDEKIELELNNASVSEISKVFKVSKEETSVKKEGIRTVKKSAEPSAKKIEVIKPVKNLIYVGQTKKAEKIIMVLKDNEMGVLYNLPLVDEKVLGNYCILNENGLYYAYIRNVCYGVKK